MLIQIGQEKVTADPSGYQWNVTPHAGDIADRQAEADEAGWIMNVDVAQLRRLSGRFFQIFVCLA